MDFINKLPQTFSSGSITFRFSLGVGLLVALIVTVALTAYLSIFHIRHTQNAIRTSTDIRQMVLEMDRGMERARRLQPIFFCNIRLWGCPPPTSDTPSRRSDRSPR